MPRAADRNRHSHGRQRSRRRSLAIGDPNCQHPKPSPQRHDPPAPFAVRQVLGDLGENLAALLFAATPHNALVVERDRACVREISLGQRRLLRTSFAAAGRARHAAVQGMELAVLEGEGRTLEVVLLPKMSRVKRVHLDQSYRDVAPAAPGAWLLLDPNGAAHLQMTRPARWSAVRGSCT
jgi:hypothetical protein